ncbi:MAG: dehydrogenase [Deltaproteobacteria bacterium]|nr:dehydrogenase [Deltaproteobacteria bacterium]
MLYRSRAPLRLGLAGGGTDVSPYSEMHGGAVLNATINMYAYATIEVLSDRQVVFSSLDRGTTSSFAVGSPPSCPDDLKLFLGTYEAVMERFNSGKHIGLRLSAHSDAPAGSGLGASSALVVALIGAFVEYLRLPLGEYEVARFAYDIERKRLGLVGGKQDQYSATFGGVNFMEFYGNDKVIVNPLRVKREYLNELQYRMLLYYTGTSRLSSAIIKQQVENLTRGAGTTLEAMHQLKRQAVAMKEALLQGKLEEIGEIFNWGWEQKKNLAENVTSPAIDEIFQKAMSSGALGGKITGAGGGGFLMLYCEPDSKQAVERALSAFDGRIMPFEFTTIGLETWSVMP